MGYQGGSGYSFQGTGGNPYANTSSAGGAPYGTNTSARRLPYYVTAPAFEYRPAAPGKVRGDLEQVLARSTSLSPNRDIRVVMDGPVVVLRGAVANDHDRSLAEALLRLSPGVHEVRNELEVPEITPQPRPAP